MTEQQAKNILAFLDRVQVRGTGEAAALLDAVKAVQSMISGGGEKDPPKDPPG